MIEFVNSELTSYAFVISGSCALRTSSQYMDAVEQNMHTVLVKLFKSVRQMKVGHAIFM